MYEKTAGVMGSVWPEICSYATDVQLLLPSADVVCVAPHAMDLEQQLLTVASGNFPCKHPLHTPAPIQPPPPPLHQPPCTSSLTEAYLMRSCLRATIRR